VHDVLDGCRIAVVIPALNEERWIASTIRTLPSYVDHIVVVDDGSSDATAEVVRALDDARVMLCRNASPTGVGAAIALGYRQSSEAADVVAVMAGDGQMDPDDLEAIVLPIVRGKADYVKGDRLAHPSVREAMPTARRLGTTTFAALTRLAIGLPSLSDSQCGYTAIRVDALRRIDLDALWPSYGYPNDLLGAVVRAGLRVAEVPVRPVYRGEASGLRPWHLPFIGYVIARSALRRFAAERRTLPLPRDELGPPTSTKTPPAPRRERFPDAPRARP